MLAVCTKWCYKCRRFKRKNPHIPTITLDNSFEGLGDFVSVLTYCLHIPHCSGCEGRRKKFNEWFPMNWLPLRMREPVDHREIRHRLQFHGINRFPVVFRDNGTFYYPS